MKRNDNSSMYTGTPCDVCAGPTLRLERGSIWCPAEDKRHPGGHFVTRVAFERSPNKQPRKSVVEIAKGDGATYLSPVRAIKPRVAAVPAKTLRARESNGFGGGYDDFVESDR